MTGGMKTTNVNTTTVLTKQRSTEMKKRHANVLKYVICSFSVGWRRSRVVTFTAIRLRGPGFKPRPEQIFENENFCFRSTLAVVKACHPCRVRPIKTLLYKT